MGKRFRMSTALDVDDLLFECIPYALRLANEKYKFDPPITIHEVDRWGKLGTRADVIFEYFDDPEFFRTQPVIKGAKEFVRKLCTMTDVFITTSVPPSHMGIRAERITQEFPEIPLSNILMGTRKDLINVDILFDDGMHNVLRSNAAFPILMRRPWNQRATGILAVNNYDEFLKLVEVIKKGYAESENHNTPPDILVLIGPSGSGKNDVARHLIEKIPSLSEMISYTTMPPSEGISHDRYRHISREEFIAMSDRGEFFESTMYAGHGFGSRKCEVEQIIADGKTPLAVMDICGAMSLKTCFGKVTTVYIKRTKRDLLTNILNGTEPVEEKVNRVISLDDERRNEEICDLSFENSDSEATADMIIEALGLK